MTNVVRGNRTLEDRARFGLGWDTQDDETVPATDRELLTVEGVLEGAPNIDNADVAVHLADTTSAHAAASVDAIATTGGGTETIKVVGNAGASKTLGLTIPPTLLVDEVIE